MSRPDTDFFCLSESGRILAIGALRRLDAGLGEIKSMHTVAGSRGTGIGAAMLEHLMAHARANGMTRLSLETGLTYSRVSSDSESFGKANATTR